MLPATYTHPDNNKSKLAYAELFRVVLNIPEKDVQLRILDAVNGTASTKQIVQAMCPNCKHIFDNFTCTRKTSATQTDINEKVSHVNNQPFKIKALSLDTRPTGASLNKNEICDQSSPPSFKKTVETSDTLKNRLTTGPNAVKTKPCGIQPEMVEETQKISNQPSIPNISSMIKTFQWKVSLKNQPSPDPKPVKTRVFEGVQPEMAQEKPAASNERDTPTILSYIKTEQPLEVVQPEMAEVKLIASNECDTPTILSYIKTEQSIGVQPEMAEIKLIASNQRDTPIISSYIKTLQPQLEMTVKPLSHNDPSTPLWYQNTLDSPNLSSNIKTVSYPIKISKLAPVQPSSVKVKRAEGTLQPLKARTTLNIRNTSTSSLMIKTFENLKMSQTNPVNAKPSVYEIQPEMQAETPVIEKTQGVKRKRRRKVRLPQVVKRSHAQMAQTQLQPKLKIRKNHSKSKSPVKVQMQPENLGVVSVFDGRDSIDSLPVQDWMEELLNEIKEHKSKEEHIMRIMAEECLNAERRTDGLLAIHRSIVANDLNALRRQIFVWKKLRQVDDLNKLLTDEDENCLQLAIMQDCYPKLIEILLEEGFNANEIDNTSNTCIHLAILNEIELESMRLIMQKIDLKLLLQLNDDGYTPLHVAVRTDSYLRAEIILDTLDERLQTKRLFARNVRNTSANKDEFQKFYGDVCKQMERKNADFTRNAQPKLKKMFLEARDRKSGNTALFFAVENKLEHFIYFLLAHFTDPRITNFSGQDAKSFYSEFGKTLNLSLKVDNAMESVVAVLGN